MAAVFDFGDPEASGPRAGRGEAIGSGDGSVGGSVDGSFERVVAGLFDCEPGVAMRRLGRYRARLDAAEAMLLASVVAGDGGDTRGAVRVAARGSKRSRFAARRAAGRGAVVAKNAELAGLVDSGELSAAQLDLLARASAKLGDQVLVDAGLLGRLVEADDDGSRLIVDEYIAEHSKPAEVQSEHDRQRALRRCSRFLSKRDGLDTISVAGDSVSIAAMWEHILAGADRLYRGDGGRDIAAADHPRSVDQRRFDAAAGLLGDATAPATSGPAPGPETGQIAPAGSAPAGEPARRSRPTTAPKPRVTTSRPLVVVTTTIDKLLGLDPDACAEMIGVGPIPDSVLTDYLDQAATGAASLLGMVFGTDGQPLWLGREHRHASAAQFVALAVRDRGCVLCGAAPTRCETHHITPWNSPAQGQTDIDKLALVCPSCHHYLHDHHLSLERDPGTRTWTTRPATPDEIAPTRPDRSRQPGNGHSPQRK